MISDRFSQAGAGPERAHERTGRYDRSHSRQNCHQIDLNQMDATQIKAQIDAALADIDKLPSMPMIASRLTTMASNPDVDIKALAEEISHDPAITAAIIRLSNSAYYAPSRPIRSVQEAIMTLGLNVVKNIAMVAASRGILKVDLESYKMDAADMWDHCLVVGEVAQSIALLRKTKTGDDVAFTAGLLHDMGKVVLVHFFKTAYRQVIMDMDSNPDVSFLDLERKYTGYTHAEIGAKLLEQWQFPAELVEAVRYSYEPEKASINQELCCVVHVANAITLSAGVGLDIGGLSQHLSAFALEKLGMGEREMQAIYSRMPEFLEKLQDLRSF
ncbi:MAG: HDOD domain-containing protein [Leptospiraceae bacterium]|nr:HDOD domain-containing protein [Leptospiraceae bacterium]